MKAKDDRAVSKFMSYVLRHRPAAAGLTLDVNGWCELGALLGAVQERYAGITIEDIRRIVAENDKQRFALDEVGQRIRANQGHSVEIELGLEPVEPPELLFHGTATRFVEGIRREGLRKRNRQHVHLSRDEETAHKVGTRHGVPVILVIRAREMTAAGHVFFCLRMGKSGKIGGQPISCTITLPFPSCKTNFHQNSQSSHQLQEPI